MPSVNDLIVYLNKKLGLHIPVLPLANFPAFMIVLWKRAVTNWISDETPPSTVDIDVTSDPPLEFPIGGVCVSTSKASIQIKNSSP